jgi:hypothetical protein
MKIDWAKKLTSRKLWLAVAGFVTGLILAFNGSAEVADSCRVYNVGRLCGGLYHWRGACGFHERWWWRWHSIKKIL